ncbi:hypothetical protein CBR_g49666 [Chara braunii]|uniref:DDE Tnp4 domain-containing protein n=1 Tax=Chara braunii TaxID=69332 RepID=A0A388M5M5_CHABU|nr:hypothetical protein CBR_g49666 [Chara braunii]|eukprot:GBG89815.1 hypothetical protein CBR_g49666 [Chara braunii]
MVVCKLLVIEEMDSPVPSAGSLEEWEDMLFFLVFAITQWVHRRNAAAMVVLEAVAFAPFLFGDAVTSLPLLTSGVMHGFALTSLAAEELGRRMERRRRIWVVERSGGVWRYLQRVGSEHDKVFVRFCRLPRPLFFEVLGRIAPHIQRAPTNFRNPIPVGQKFAMALIRWATGGYYRQTSHGMGMGLASALCCNDEVANAIISEYGHLLRWPTDPRMQEVENALEAEGFAGCIGAIDCTHLYIDKPKGMRGDCNYHHIGQFSVVAQVVCDHECRITSVYVGCAGSVHDSRVLRILELFREASQGAGVFSEGGAHLHDDRHVGRYVLGDQGYPLLPWIMTPIGRTTTTTQERTYDNCHSAVRSCIEHCFGRLKAVWRNFIRPHISNMKTICKEVMAICILYNLMIEHRVDFDPGVLDSSSDSNGDGGHLRHRRRRRDRHRFVRHMPDLNVEPMVDDDPTYGSALGALVCRSLIQHVDHHVAVHGAPPPYPWR